MEIENITKEQVALMVQIVNETPIFSVAEVPVGHKHYEAKHEHFARICKDVRYLESLGFLEDLTDKEGPHQKANALIAAGTGYTYRVYAITNMGVWMFQGYVQELQQEIKYRNSIN
jgi:hypothetical protein